MPALKPSSTRLPYSLDYTSTHHVPYGVPQHIYNQSYYNDPAHLTIGRGHLACVQYAGGKSYPRRKNLYSDENRNIRDEIKFRSYYNRPKHEDPNTLPTGFAWRLLHLPAKDAKPFKLYKHSKTLPQLGCDETTTDKESIVEKYKPRTIRKYTKHHSERNIAEPVFEDENKYVSYRDRPELKDEYIPRKNRSEKTNKQNTASATTANYSEPPCSTTNTTELAEPIEQPKPQHAIEPKPQISETVFPTEEVTSNEKKKKKKKGETESEDTVEKPSLNRVKSLVEEKVVLSEPEIIQNVPESDIQNEQIPESEIVDRKEDAISDPEPEFKPESSEEPVKDTGGEASSPEQQTNVEEEIIPEENQSSAQESKPAEELIDTVSEEQLATDIQIEESNKMYEEDKISELNMENDAVQPEATLTDVSNEQQNLNEEVEENVTASENVPTEEKEARTENDVLEETKQDDFQEVVEDTPEDDSNAIAEDSKEDLITPPQDIEDSTLIPTTINETNNYHVEDDNVLLDITETITKRANGDEEISETQVREEKITYETQIHDGISEVSYTETNTTFYTREGTVIETVDAQDSDALVISEEIESSQDALNNADHTTDEEIVDIQEQ